MHALISPTVMLLAQAPQRQSYLMWMYQALGLFYAFVIPMSALLVFIGAVIVVFAARRPSVIAAYLVFLPLPILIGAYATVEGMIATLLITDHTSGIPQASDLLVGYGIALVTTQLGILLTFPSFFVLAIGLFVRTILWRPEGKLRENGT